MLLSCESWVLSGNFIIFIHPSPPSRQPFLLKVQAFSCILWPWLLVHWKEKTPSRGDILHALHSTAKLALLLTETKSPTVVFKVITRWLPIVCIISFAPSTNSLPSKREIVLWLMNISYPPVLGIRPCSFAFWFRIKKEKVVVLSLVSPSTLPGLSLAGLLSIALNWKCRYNLPWWLHS